MCYFHHIFIAKGFVFNLVIEIIKTHPKGHLLSYTHSKNEMKHGHYSPCRRSRGGLNSAITN